MKPRLSLALAVGLLAALVVSDAQACHRCGIFGRGCRFASHVNHVAAYTPPASVQTFNFVNSFPTPYLAAPSGQSVYGYSLASQSYSVDPAQVLDRSGRLAELSLELATRGNDGYNSTAQSALAVADAADRRQANALVALSAIGASGQSQVAGGGDTSTSSSYSIRVENGRLTRTDGDTPGPVASDGVQTCARCHDGSGRNNVPRGVVLNGTVAMSLADYERSVHAIIEEKMPPGVKLTPRQKTAAISGLAPLLEVQGSPMP